MSEEKKTMSKEIEQYFETLDKEIQKAYETATTARKKGHDPETKVDIPLAKNMAERVEGLISDVAPQILGAGIPKRIMQLEKEYGVLDWRVGFKVAEEVAKEKFCKFKDKLEAMEIGIRVGFAYLTIGIVSAPLEGFVELKIKKRQDGGEYFSICYSGPIRGAGGTAAATSVILADYVRVKMGYQPYDPTPNEINRYATEIQDYHERVTNLQYFPTEEEVRFMASHVPVEINGDPTEEFEVSNYKDQPRIETNRIRGGICLVMAEGLCQKTPKIWKRLSKWGKELELEHWSFLAEFLELQKKKKAKAEEGTGEKKKEKITPNYTFINDLVAGRPVLTHPLAKGGFRLRYGRTRTSGFSAAAIHPATMHLLNNYIATGTQLKVERPGKAAAITVCETIEGPIIKLKNGNVIRIENEKDAKKEAENLKEILFLGDLLFNYGDFSENGHILAPAGYCEEWWTKELEKATVDLFGNIDTEKLAELLQTQPEQLNNILKQPITHTIDAETAINITEKLRIPLHPRYTYHWNCITKEQLLTIFKWMEKANIRVEENTIKKIILPHKQEEKRILELIGTPHILVNNEFVVIEKNEACALAYTLSMQQEISTKELEKHITENKDKTTVETINDFFKTRMRDKSGTFIGARMGRPEKAKMRKLTGSPHTLFPIGEEGGRLRCFQAANETGKVKADFPIYRCTKCNKDTIYSICEECGKPTKQLYYCKVCGGIDKPECQHGKASKHKQQEIDINYYFQKALQKTGDKISPDLIKGVKGTSNKDHIPENLIKGILRAKYDVYVNKDGTTRYDMSELPITHFKPKEIRTTVEKLRELGYTKDIKGEELKNAEQILELKPQDLILPCSPESPDEKADDVLFRIAEYIDELLIKLYEQKPYYNLKTKEDLIGHLVVGLAPHISAGLIGRIIGFSETQGMYAHPMYHAGLRRDCDGDEACVILLMDALLNFSRQFLPDKRGSRTMDSPLVLTSRLIPAEVDDQVLGMDVVWTYPLEFYNATLEYKNPWDVSVEQLKNRIDTEKQYEKFGYTHPVDSINNGIRCSAYKSLPSMEEKLKGQMDLAEKIRAVNECDVARLVIEKHFLKDTKGNLRKFSMQEFRCVKCNEKFRRPPMIGKCTKCQGKIIFTISEGSVVKYLEPSISLANKYNVSAYLKQTLELTKRRIEDNFGKEKEKQEGLGKWFG